MTFGELIKSISKKEWRLVFVLSALMLIIAFLPALTGLIMAPDNFIYNGSHSLNTADYQVYYSYLGQVKSGSFLLKNLYTSEYQEHGMLNIFWLGLGLLGKLLHLSNIITFHLGRLLLIVPSVSLLYIFTAYFLKEVKWRWLAFILLLFSSGWGGFTAVLLESPGLDKEVTMFQATDLWVPESNIFLTLIHSPHMIASLSLILLIFLCLLLALDNNRYRYSLSAGVLALLLFQFHPYYFPTIFGIWLAYWLIKLIMDKSINWPIIFHGLIMFLVSLPSLAYHFWLVGVDQAIGLRASQNISLTPPFLAVIVGFGLLIPLAILGAVRIIKNKEVKEKINRPFFLFAWALAVPFLIYLPISFQRRLLEGWEFPLVMLTTVALAGLASQPKIKKWRLDFKPLVVIGFLLFFCFTNIFCLARDFVYLGYQPESVKKYYFISRDEQAALAWLKNNSSPKALVLSQGFFGRYVPAYANRRVYIGHSQESIFGKSKEQLV
ncbi:MAG: hypothetical protein V1692_02710, partial [bacterium]